MDAETRARVIAVIDSMLENMTVAEALELHSVSRSTFYKYIAKDIDLANRYIFAQESRAEMMVDELVKIADTEEDANRARNRINVRQWIAGKHKPSKYAERIDINVHQTADISLALTAAMERSRPIRDLTNVEDAQLIEAKQLTDKGTTGLKPDETASPPIPDSKDDIFS